jgi:Ribosomal protein S11
MRGAGGQVAKTGREEKSPFAGGQLAKMAANALKERGFSKVDVLLRGKGGHRGQKSPGRAASAVIKMLARSGIKIRKIEDVTPIPHGGSKPPGGKRGRRV